MRKEKLLKIIDCAPPNSEEEAIIKQIKEFFKGTKISDDEEIEGLDSVDEFVKNGGYHRTRLTNVSTAKSDLEKILAQLHTWHDNRERNAKPSDAKQETDQSKKKDKAARSKTAKNLVFIAAVIVCLGLIIVGLVFTFLDNASNKWLAFFTPAGTVGAIIQMLFGLREWRNDISKSDTDAVKEAERNKKRKVGSIVLVVAGLILSVVTLYFSCFGGFFHANSLSEKTIKQHEATCTIDKYYEMECLNCNKKWNKYFEGTATGHIENSGTTILEPTCTTAGKKEFRCVVCNEKLRDDVILSVGHHTLDDGEITLPSTCSNEGIKTYHCVKCDYTETAPIEKLPHTYAPIDNYQTDSDYKNPNSTSAATIPSYCLVCNHKEDVVWSEDLFEAEQDAKIFIEDKYKAGTIIMFDEVQGLLGINLKPTNSLSGLASLSLYNATSKVLTIPTSFGNVGSSVTKVRIIGVSPALNEFSIATENFNNLKINLKNLSFTAKNGVGLDLSKVANAELEIEGSVTIKGSDGGAGISAQNLSVTGDNLTVEGGKGADGQNGTKNSSGTEGHKGGCALIAENLTIDINGLLNCVGGTGGVGGCGIPNSGEGSNGNPGYTGGIGGSGIISNQITVRSGRINAIGGGGGQGGKGTQCNCADTKASGINNVYGGRGGEGGKGGYGVETKKIYLYQGEINAIGGRGGDSGMRGGCWKDDHSGWGTTASDGEFGTPGNGGDGVLSDCIILNDNLFHENKGLSGEIVQGENQSYS